MSNSMQRTLSNAAASPDGLVLSAEATNAGAPESELALPVSAGSAIDADMPKEVRLDDKLVLRQDEYAKRASRGTRKPAVPH